MTTVGYARVSSLGQELAVQLEKLKGCDKIFKEKRSGVDAGRPELKACLEYLREGDTLLVTKLDRLARSTADLYRIVSQLSERGISFKVADDPSIEKGYPRSIETSGSTFGEWPAVRLYRRRFLSPRLPSIWRSCSSLCASVLASF
jgi:hypothetical protein